MVVVATFHVGCRERGQTGLKHYQYMVEGVFIAQGPDEKRLGFYTTFRLIAFSARDGASRLGRLLEERMAAHDVRGNCGVVFHSYYWIHDVWEITEELYGEARRDSGFTFFRIGIAESLYLAARRKYFQMRRRWLLVRL